MWVGGQAPLSACCVALGGVRRACHLAERTRKSMETLRQSATENPAASRLKFWKASDKDADDLCDWVVKIGTLGAYKVHTASVASGPRQSTKIREQVVESTKGVAPRMTDIAAFIAEPARSQILVRGEPRARNTKPVLLVQSAVLQGTLRAAMSKHTLAHAQTRVHARRRTRTYARMRVRTPARSHGRTKARKHGRTHACTLMLRVLSGLW